MFGVCVIVDIMVIPSRLYVDAEAKGRILFALLQQRLDTPAAHDIETAGVELNYRLQFWSGWPGLGEEQDSIFRNEFLELEGGGWTNVNVTSRTHWVYSRGTILSHLTKECHMKYSFAELGIISNIHTSVEDESNMKVDDYSMTG
ncbi:MAG: hypothetical protein HETSPECPRED_006676 [Heterodermia speciosa]|uniref:Uncharacterized protein n=1 Tax=Heterodermia speciosa TaxID=116794 RepID=A0A8H3FQX6_9LECA|nr:MAG: hypothetical protein HETSPECPRED_006676 [Heterodermia speciosa]